MKVVWTEQALLRLAEVEAFIARDAPDAAERLVERLIERGAALARFPKSGRRLPEMPKSALREVIEGNYRIVYRARPKRVEVLTVFEGHRRFPTEDMADRG